MSKPPLTHVVSCCLELLEKDYSFDMEPHVLDALVTKIQTYLSLALEEENVETTGPWNPAAHFLEDLSYDEPYCEQCKEAFTQKDIDGGRCLSCGRMIIVRDFTKVERPLPEHKHVL